MIYYVEDEENIRELALYALANSGLDAQGFSCAKDFFNALKKEVPDLVLLDIMLPEIDGLEVLRRLRATQETKTIPVMMITAKGTEYDKVTGLDAGADDYLAKPFGMMELISRCKALMRRAHYGEEDTASTHAQTKSQTENQEVFHSGNVRLNKAAHSVEVNNNPVELTRKEFNLLKALMQNAGIVLTRDQLLEKVWGITYAGDTRTVDVHIQTLRQKLNEYDDTHSAGNIISTIRGVGYEIKEAY